MSINRLLDLQSENDKAGAEMIIENERFNRIRGEKPRAVSSFNLFQTPEAITERMTALLPFGITSPRILEPSAGLGNIYNTLFNRFYTSAEYVLIENSPECMKELYCMDLPATLLQRDFLTVSDIGLFDFIVMNPPFKNGVDIKHIKHAATFLKPGGTLVSLCANGPRQNAKLKPIADYWEVLPEKSFKCTGTNVSTIMLSIVKH